MEFCPHCYHPIDDQAADDSSRLCPVCGWFGDKTEINTKPYVSDDLDLSCIQLLAMFREICRMELTAEQLADVIPEQAKYLAHLKARVKYAQHSIIHFFRSTRQKKHE